MAIRVYKPVTNGRRNASVNLHEEVTHTGRQRKVSSRPCPRRWSNHHGVITCRGRGGGHKRLYRKIDFNRRKDGIDAVVKTIEYDPNRTCHIALIEYADGIRRYILAPKDLKVDTVVRSSMEAIEPEVGCTMPLKFVPLGMTVHNIEFEPRRGGKLCRSAGSNPVDQPRRPLGHLVLPSGEIRQVSVECRATIGEVENSDHQHVVLGKAGRSVGLGVVPKSVVWPWTPTPTRWVVVKVVPRVAASRSPVLAPSPRWPYTDQRQVDRCRSFVVEEQAFGQLKV